MKTEFIPYEQALELKELGFDEPCFGRYYYKESYPMLNPNSGETELVFEFGQYIKQTEITILAPLYQQCWRWFREKHNIKPCFDWHPTEEYRYCIYYSVNTYFQKCDFETYEEAELECLIKLIEIVNNK